MRERVCVVGGGIIGLSTAYSIASRPGHSAPQVTILSKAFSPNITSDCAGALWRPAFLRDTPEHLQDKWGKATFEKLAEIARRDDQGVNGVFMCAGYELYGKVEKEPSFKDYVIDFRNVSREELLQVGGESWLKAKTAWAFTTPMIDSPVYLRWLMNRLAEKNVTMKQQVVSSLESLLGEFDVVVNCSGLGSRELVNDKDVAPIRGIVLHIAAPWEKIWFSADDMDGEGSMSHSFPRHNVVICGGVHQDDRWETKATTEEIKEPSLAKAPIVGTSVGLRPSRSIVRVEKDPQNPRIIHNYGHGGSGFTLHWGCAEDAADLVFQSFKNQSKL